MTFARTTTPLLAGLALVLAGPVARADDAIERAAGGIDSDQALAHVAFLASDELGGRAAGSDGGRRAGDYLAERLAELRLDPGGPGESYFREFDMGDVRCRNVVAILRGARDGDEHVAIGAHYDHVGMGGGLDFFTGRGKFHNGADDNASGTAALLEVAEAFAELAREGRRPDRSIVFCFFDAEENGLVGSEAYAADPALPIAGCIAMINMDMVGRARRSRLNVLAAASGGAALEDLVRSSGAGLDLDLRIEPYVVPNSDHWSFYRRDVPVAFLTTGVHRDYHRATDDTDKIETAGLAATGRHCFRMAYELAASDERFEFAALGFPPVEELLVEVVESYLPELGEGARELLERFGRGREDGRRRPAPERERERERRLF